MRPTISMTRLLYSIACCASISSGAIRMVDVLVGVLGLKEQHLRDHQVREVVLDERRQKDDPLPQQSREDVERALTAGRLLHDHRNQCHRASPCHASTFRRYSCVVDQEIERTLLLEDAAPPRHTGADERELRPGLRTELSVERGFVLAQGTLEAAPDRRRYAAAAPKGVPVRRIRATSSPSSDSRSSSARANAWSFSRFSSRITRARCAQSPMMRLISTSGSTPAGFRWRRPPLDPHQDLVLGVLEVRHLDELLVLSHEVGSENMRRYASGLARCVKLRTARRAKRQASPRRRVT